MKKNVKLTLKAQIKDSFILDENEMKNITGGGDINDECTRSCDLGRSCNYNGNSGKCAIKPGTTYACACLSEIEYYK